MNNQKYVVIARFDEQMTNRLEQLRKTLHEKGILKKFSQWSPHITFAAYDGIDIEVLLNWTKQFTQKTRCFEISISSLGILPPSESYPDTIVLFAAPSPSKKLIDNYYAFHEKLDCCSGEIGWHYTKKCIHPYPIHSSIGVFEKEQVQKAMDIILENNIFKLAKITALEVYTYPMKLIERFDLA